MTFENNNMRQRKSINGVLVLATLIVAGCSNKVAYEVMQANKKEACKRVAEGQAREDCMRSYERSFAEYERERNRAVGK